MGEYRTLGRNSNLYNVNWILVLSVLNLFSLARVYLAVFILSSMCCFSVMLLSIVALRILVLVVYGILDPFIFTRACP